jgi:hypothetical protein
MKKHEQKKATAETQEQLLPTCIYVPVNFAVRKDDIG